MRVEKQGNSVYRDRTICDLGGFLYAAWKKKRTHYAVTNRRVIVVQDGWKRQMASTYIRYFTNPHSRKRFNRNWHAPICSIGIHAVWATWMGSMGRDGFWDYAHLYRY
jgi:hypothetical protein